MNCSDGDSFLVRQKDQISINTICDGEIELIHLLTSPTSPFMSSAQDELRRSRLITTDRHQNFKLWNLATSTADKFQFDEKLRPTSSWNIIKFFQRDVFLFATKNKLRRYDTRTSPDESDVFDFYENYESCSRISSLAASNYSDLFHLGTSHKLFTLDSRYLEKEINESNCVLKWTHQMDCCPSILKTLNVTHSDSEIIVGASPSMGEMRIFELEKVEKKSKLTKMPYQYFSSSSLPYMPPTLAKAYTVSRRNGLALNPKYELEERLSYCLTGLDIYDGDIGDPVMLTSNSLGDVFASTIGFANSNKEDVTLPIKRYTELLSACENKPFYASDKANFSGLRKVLNCPKLNDGFIKVEAEYDDIETVVKQKRCGRWKKPTHTLYEYKDVLARDLLSIWDVAKPDDKIEQSSEISLPQPNKSNMVSSWLQTSVMGDDSMVTIPHVELSEPKIASTPITPKPKTKKKNTKTYVKGF